MPAAIESLLRGNGSELFIGDFFNTIDPKRRFDNLPDAAKRFSTPWQEHQVGRFLGIVEERLTLDTFFLSVAQRRRGPC